MNNFTRAWIILILLSVTTTLLAERADQMGLLLAGVVLLLSGLKARIILLDYLELRHAPSFRAGFVGFLIAFGVIAFGLYAIV